MSFDSVTSRAEATIPLIFPASSKGGRRLRAGSSSCHPYGERGLLLRAGLGAGDDVLKHFRQPALVFTSGTVGKGLADVFFRSAAQNFLHALAYIGKTAFPIKDGNHIGETGHQTPYKFLLLAQLFLDFTALGDVHDRALEPDTCGRKYRERQSRRPGNKSVSLFAKEFDFVVSERAFRFNFREASVGGHRDSGRAREDCAPAILLY